MKKLLSLSVLAVLASAASAQAQVISVEFSGGGTIGAAQTAGVIPELGSTWNIDNSQIANFAPTTSGESNLMDSTGATTTVSETKTTYAYYGPNGSTTGFASAGDNALYSNGPLTGYSNSTDNPAPLDLTGLNASLTYNLFVYVRNDQPADGASLTATDSLDSQTYSLQTIGDEGTGYLIASGATTVGNYFEFTGLTGSSSLEVDLTSANNSGFTLDGFQLQVAGGAATPEPSAIWMLSLGLLSVGFFVRRNRAAREI